MVKIKRNNKCPCGSGKKYKHCCFLEDTKNNNLKKALEKSNTLEDVKKHLNEKRKVYVLKVELTSMFVREKKFKWDKKGIWRIIEIRGDQTLYSLHLKIQEAFDWDNDHMYSFYMNRKIYDPAFEYSGNPLGESDNDPEIRDLNLVVQKKFSYLFDYGNELIHEIQVKKIIKDPDLNISYPRIRNKNGRVPLQYG